VSPSEQLLRAAKKAKLHPVTWVVIGAAIAHLAGDLLSALVIYHRYVQAESGVSLAEVVATIVHALSYSTLFFGTAAMVEFLFRIWGELRQWKAQSPNRST
jgi:hypothetical protein